MSEQQMILVNICCDLLGATDEDQARLNELTAVAVARFSKETRIAAAEQWELAQGDDFTGEDRLDLGAAYGIIDSAVYSVAQQFAYDNGYRETDCGPSLFVDVSPEFEPVPGPGQPRIGVRRNTVHQKKSVAAAGLWGKSLKPNLNPTAN